MSDPMDAIRATFFEECAELLEELEGGLLALQDGDRHPDTIDTIFRAVHSIKGGAATFAMSDLVGYAHEFETALDALRAGRLRPDARVISIFLQASDRLGDIVAMTRQGRGIGSVDTSDLRALVEASGGRADEGCASKFTPVRIDIPNERTTDATSTTEPAMGGAPDAWMIEFEPLPDLLRSGNEPLLLFRRLESMGRIEVTAETDDLPSLDALDVATPRLHWRIRLEPNTSDLTKDEIEAVFDFVFDSANIAIHRIEAAEANDGKADGAASAAQRDPKSNEPIAIVPEDHNPDAPPSAPDASRGRLAPTIRVDLARVDRLVDLVGELVISQSMLVQEVASAGLDQHSPTVTRLEDLQQLTRDMQDSVMAIRAQPVKSLFQRMTRIVREAAQATGKDVRLSTEGDGTEIDKTVVERLADPLTHMIRNAVDHGIEDTATRLSRGKPETGSIRLCARQQSDRVIIEVTDDGAGIDRDRVLARAVSRGLVPADAILETNEIDRLLFKPGFSTTDAISALSGRGVGLDVVQNAIRDLNGSISVHSVEGQGCTISLSLPLTLAILDGMIVRSRRQRMVIPLAPILETQILRSARIRTLGPSRDVAWWHDRFVPLLDLGKGMGFAAGDPVDEDDIEDRAILFVKPDDGGVFALRVDAIEAQRQVVIKGIADNFGHVSCVSAATILGDGQVALIIDLAGLAAVSGLNKVTPSERPLEAIAL